MPESDPAARAALIKFLAYAGIPKQVLELGPGSGYYGRTLPVLSPGTQVVAVEIFQPYIDKYHLKKVYQRVYCDDIRTFPYSTEPADLVIAADVLEHLTKDECVDLVSRLKLAYPRIMITIPIIPYEQGPVNGNKAEAHLHNWTTEEVKQDLGMKLVSSTPICGIFEWRTSGR